MQDCELQGFSLGFGTSRKSRLVVKSQSCCFCHCGPDECAHGSQGIMFSRRLGLLLRILVTPDFISWKELNQDLFKRSMDSVEKVRR